MCANLRRRASFDIIPPAAREHSAGLSSKLRSQEQELQRASAKLTEAAAAAKAASEQHEASLSALRREAATAATAAAEAHGTTLAAAQAARDEALKKAADVERDASASLQRLETERDDAMQEITKLQEKARTLFAAAERVPGLELQAEELNVKLVRSRSRSQQRLPSAAV